MGQTLHHVSLGSKLSVEALARRVHHILRNKETEDNLLCDVWHKKGWTEVTSGDIVKSVRTATETCRIQDRGIDPYMIGVHSLRAGGKMVIEVMGYKDSTITTFGRWSLDT